MIEFWVYSDIHKDSPIAMDINMMEKSGKGVIKSYIGDNYDLKNCLKDRVQIVKDSITFIKNYFHVFVTGNHELDHERSLAHVYKKVLFTHGDYVLWGEKKADEYRAKKPGASFFKRKFIIPLFQKYRALFKKVYKLDQEQIERSIQYMKSFNCKYIVMGHTHCSEVQYEHYGIYTIILVPRGKTILKLDL